MSTIKSQIINDMKVAMKSHDKARLTTIRLIQAALKQREVDERIELDDTQVLAILDKMVKQRRESIKQYLQANRQTLADQEQFEVDVIQTYLPTPLTDDALNTLITDAIAKANANSIKDMGKVMAIVKPQVQGRADISTVSGQIKQLLNA